MYSSKNAFTLPNYTQSSRTPHANIMNKCTVLLEVAFLLSFVFAVGALVSNYSFIVHVCAVLFDVAFLLHLVVTVRALQPHD